MHQPTEQLEWPARSPKLAAGSMENLPPAHAMLNWFGRLSVHQDFFWFVSLLMWSLALIVWWRHPDRRTHWAWLPAVAGAAIAHALIQFGMFNPTLDAFQERLNPGTVADYRPALINPYWLGDVLLGVALAGLLAVWGWLLATLAGRPWLRWVAAGLAGAAGVMHLLKPAVGGWMLALLAWPAAASLARWCAPRGMALTGLGLAGLVPLLSTVGPVALATGTLQRMGPPTPMGLVAGAVQMVIGLAVLAGLARSTFGALPRESRPMLWADLRWPAAGAVLLIVAGVSFGVVTGRDNRREILENRLRTTAAHAAVFDPALLAPLERPEFWRDHLPPKDAAIRVPSPSHDGAAAIRRRLIQEVVSTPFLKEARLLVLRDGWLIAVLSSENGGSGEYLRRATPEDIRRWEHPAPFWEESPVPEIGYNYYSRAPVLSADGRMLAWLDAVRGEFYLTVERRWRAAPFLITALGVVLLAFVFAQRRSAREREAALREAAVAAEASRIKTSFFANVSHELRTPLQGILGFSELLERELSASDAQRNWLRALREQGELMKRLVNDLIDLSAAEAGAFQLAPRVVAPGALVVQTVESFRARAQAKGLELRSHLGATVPAWALVDGERVRQLVINLVNNAIKFTARGSVHVTLDAQPRADGRVELFLAVRDTGPGIPAAQRDRLFRPFSRLAQTGAVEGSGLGLALCAALCRAMDGSLRVESDGITGSCFVATLVAAPAEAPAIAKPVAPGGAASRPPRVLIVDDNALLRELFAGFLAGQGASVGQAATGAGALAQAADVAWDVMLLDLALPDGSGADFVGALRERVPGARIIGVSAHAGQAEREAALAAGMDAFLVKPVALDELWREIVEPGSTPGAGGGAGAQAAAFAAAGEVGAPLRAAFARELPGKRAELTAAVDAEDWARVRAVAHYLRSSALVVRDRALFDACTGLEQAATARDREALATWWPRCRHAMDATK